MLNRPCPSLKVLPFVVLALVASACDSGWQDESLNAGTSSSTSSSSSSSSSGVPNGWTAEQRAAAQAANPECWDTTGFGGQGCFKCAPTKNDELLAACTDSAFEVFDNKARINGFDPRTPKPALPTPGAAAPPFDPGTSASPPPTLPPAPACPIETVPNPVMVVGATGFPLETIAKAMGNEATMFYLEKGSCDGVASLVLNEPKLSGEVVYFGTDGSKNRCVLPQSHPADIAISTLFAQTCANKSGLSEPVTLPAEVQDFLGPVNAVMFAAPATSPEAAISAEAAYRIYGMGAQSGVTPWGDESFIFRRTASSGNQQAIAMTLGLSPETMRGRDSGGSSNMLKALLSSPQPNRTVGISSAEIVDVNRDVAKALAYQHYGQPAAFYPDSDPSKLDRKNVRDGHYFMWLSLHVLARTSAGDPVSIANPALDPTGNKRAARDAAVKKLVYVMVNRQRAPLPSVDIFGSLKRTGNVPQCAMHVQRTREGAPLSPSKPAVACDCAFDAASPGAHRPECKSCTTSSECGDKICSFGFCE